jgi:hypothetical protein
VCITVVEDDDGAPCERVRSAAFLTPSEATTASKSASALWGVVVVSLALSSVVAEARRLSLSSLMRASMPLIRSVTNSS